MCPPSPQKSNISFFYSPDTLFQGFESREVSKNLNGVGGFGWRCSGLDAQKLVATQKYEPKEMLAWLESTV